MPTLAERFGAKVDRNGEHHVWRGSHKADGTSLAGKTATGGRLDLSGLVSAGSTTSEPTAPSAPTNLSATGGDGRIDLVWTAPLTGGGKPITGYKVYRGRLVPRHGTTLSYLDTAVVNGETYGYQVTAVNDVSEGQSSNTATAGEAPARSLTVTAGPKRKT